MAISVLRIDFLLLMDCNVWEATSLFIATYPNERERALLNAFVRRNAAAVSRQRPDKALPGSRASGELQLDGRGPTANRRGLTSHCR